MAYLFLSCQANIFVHFKPYNHDAINAMHELHQGEHGPSDDYHDLSAQSKTKPAAAKPISRARHLRRAESSNAVYHEENTFGYVTELQKAVRDNDMAKTRSLLEAMEKTGDFMGLHTPNSYGWTPVHMSVRTANVDMTKLLVQYGANVNGKTRNGGTTLWWAKKILKPSHPIVHYLYDIEALDESVMDG